MKKKKKNRDPENHRKRAPRTHTCIYLTRGDEVGGGWLEQEAGEIRYRTTITNEVVVRSRRYELIEFIMAMKSCHANQINQRN
jgi:predicted SprT family Zn-dependent metalloprotease